MSVTVSSFELISIFEHLNVAAAYQLASALKENAATFNIHSDVALAHFLAQAGHESGEFRRTVENLNYSAEQLVKVWPKRFTHEKDTKKHLANDFARNPEKIANTVYARKELDNDAPGDGWKFRGRGFFQLTGKANYRSFQRFYNSHYPKKINLMKNPDLIATDFNLALISSLWYFDRKVMQKIQIETASVEQVTRLVNGGLTGLQDRQKLFVKAMQFPNYVDLFPDTSRYA